MEESKNEEDIEISNCYAVSNARLVIDNHIAYTDLLAKGFD